MELSQIIESLDSLWFFSNPFFSSITQPTPRNPSDENSLTKEAAPKIFTPTVQHKQNDSPSSKPINPRCSKCGGPTEKEKRKEYIRSKRNILEEPVDLGLVDETNYCFEDCGLLTDSEEQEEEEENTWYSTYQLKLPPLDLDDPMAVKDHLKSWAYEVACTVR